MPFEPSSGVFSTTDAQPGGNSFLSTETFSGTIELERMR